MLFLKTPSDAYKLSNRLYRLRVITQRSRLKYITKIQPAKFQYGGVEECSLTVQDSISDANLPKTHSSRVTFQRFIIFGLYETSDIPSQLTSTCQSTFLTRINLVSITSYHLQQYMFCLFLFARCVYCIANAAISTYESHLYAQNEEDFFRYNFPFSCYYIPFLIFVILSAAHIPISKVDRFVGLIPKERTFWGLLLFRNAKFRCFLEGGAYWRKFGTL